MQTLHLAPSLLLSLALVSLPACSGDDAGTSATASASATSTGSTASSSSSSTGSTSAESDAGSASSDGSSSTGSTTEDSASTTEDSASTTEDSASTTTASSGSASDSAATTEATTGGGSALMFDLQDPEIYANCQPIIADDPLHVKWTVMADNAAGIEPATLAVSDVVVTFDPDGAAETRAISLAPSTFGPIAAGAVELFETAKEETPGGLPACSYCDKPVLFEMTWTVNDEPPTQGSTQATLSCVY
ncbi:MAG: hypothetical protein R3A79_26315 [Nannocystaceae bacterium]